VLADKDFHSLAFSKEAGSRASQHGSPGLSLVKGFGGEAAETKQVQGPCLPFPFINLSALTQQPHIDLLSDCSSIIWSHQSLCKKTIKINTDRSLIITATLGRNKACFFPNAETIN